MKFFDIDVVDWTPKIAELAENIVPHKREQFTSDMNYLLGAVEEMAVEVLKKYKPYLKEDVDSGLKKS